MLQGKATYLGIAQLVIAYALKEYASEEEVKMISENLIDGISLLLLATGAAQAIYGRWRIRKAKYKQLPVPGV